MHRLIITNSVVSMIKAQLLQLPMVAMEHIQQLDLYVNGADVAKEKQFTDYTQPTGDNTQNNRHL